MAPIIMKYQDKIGIIPQHLQYATSSKAIKYAELLGAVNLMSKEKCITFTKEEFVREFGKHGINGLKGVAKRNKVSFELRVVDDGKNVYVFKNDLK